MPEPAVVVEGLIVRHGALTAVDGISLTAAAGQVTALLGPNGAGKTSTVEVLEGYRRPDGGRVRVLGLDPVADHAALVPRLGVMLQRGGVYPTMPAGEVLALFARYWADPVPPGDLLASVGLVGRERTPYRRLSGGEQQRLSLALALVGRPEVAFLDEPTAGVDPAGRLAIRDVVRRLRDDGVAVVLTTHELEEAEHLADRVVIVDRGRVLADGSAAEVMGEGDRIAFSAPAGVDVGPLSARVGGTAAEVRPGEYEVAVAPTPANVAALTAWLAERDLPLADLRAGRQRLEDVFLRLTAGGAA